MKFTALVEMMTVRIVSATSTGAGRTVTPNSGSDSSCTPLNAITPAASICPASFVSQSSSRMSSSTPTAHTMTAPISTPVISPPWKIWDR